MFASCLFYRLCSTGCIVCICVVLTTHVSRRPAYTLYINLPHAGLQFVALPCIGGQGQHEGDEGDIGSTTQNLSCCCHAPGGLLQCLCSSAGWPRLHSITIDMVSHLVQTPFMTVQPLPAVERGVAPCPCTASF